MSRKNCGLIGSSFTDMAKYKATLECHLSNCTEPSREHNYTVLLRSGGSKGQPVKSGEISYGTGGCRTNGLVRSRRQDYKHTKLEITENDQVLLPLSSLRGKN